MTPNPLGKNLILLSGAVNTGILIDGDHALLIDCCDSVTPGNLHELGINHVDHILCTQHRRPNMAGAYRFVERGTALVVSEKDHLLFEEADEYWTDFHNRWHLYHARPGTQVPARSLPVNRSVRDGDRITWGGFEIRVLETPGMTDGSVAYYITGHGNQVCFSGDTIYAAGQVWELYSLQQGFARLLDYHGFLGAWRTLCSSARKLAALPVNILIPSHGAPFSDIPQAVALLEKRLAALWNNYCAISGLHFHFPGTLKDQESAPARMLPSPKQIRPEWVARVTYTSYAILSKTGAAFLIDCGHDTVIDTLENWLGLGRITGIDGCWVTHYHDDHVDSLHRFVHVFRKPIYTIREMADVLEHPNRYCLPCISPCPVPVAKACVDGESWDWHEFRFTAYHFPGQTYYHSGLLVEGNGQRIFFSGDTGTPTGLDDYTAGNRVFLGAERGSRRCIDLWRKTQPDQIVSQHQNLAFAYTLDQLDHMERNLQEREEQINALTPWTHANFALDEGWIRVYPYAQETQPGERIKINLQFTNHGDTPAEGRAEPVLPPEWCWSADTTPVTVNVPPKTDGEVYPWLTNPDATLSLYVNIPQTACRGTFCIPFRIYWNGQYLGPCRHAICVVF